MAFIAVNYGPGTQPSAQVQLFGPLDYSAGQSLYTLMTNAVTAGKFPAFATKDYPTMGHMVTTIGDVGSTPPGYFWMFSVNGKRSEVGVDGDHLDASHNFISWNYVSESCFKTACPHVKFE